MSKDFQKIKTFLNSFKVLLGIAFLLLVLGVVLGYAFARENPKEAAGLLKRLEESLRPLKDAGPFEFFLIIFLNNALKIFLATFLGIFFGIFPFFFILANGEILGFFVFFSQKTIGINNFLLGILPHGIIEIPVMLLGTAMGMRIGKKAFLRVFQGKKGIKQDLSLSFQVFLKILLPLLLLAALIETFVTSRLMGISF